MDGFFIRILLPMFLLISLTLVISHAKAIESPRRRPERETQDRIKVFVRPDVVELYEGESVDVTCRAKGGRKIKETPYISFHRQVNEFMRMPIGSGVPGYVIRPVPNEELKGDKNDHRVKVVLSLGQYAYETLEWGDNLFGCKASDVDGRTKTEYFTVIKQYGFREDSGRPRRHHRPYQYNMFGR